MPIYLTTTLWTSKSDATVLHVRKTIVDSVTVACGHIERFELEGGEFATGRLDWAKFLKDKAWIDYVVISIQPKGGANNANETNDKRD